MPTLLLIIVTLISLGCQSQQGVNHNHLEQAIIYEANIRQYSKEGTFVAFTQDIPKLKALGVKIIWLMPIHPISVTKRKAEGNLLVEDIESIEERKKYLGSYYAVADYRGINPEFGSNEDLRKLIEVAHHHDMYVILDWVPNHTGWDHPWINKHPDFYTRDSQGNMTDPLNENGKSMGWTDVADLNYNNKKLHDVMVAEMLYWVEQFNVDGFRCDVAGSVPIDFWHKAITRLRDKKSIFMLAEAWEPELLHHHLFDMAYAWEGHHLLNQIAQGKKTAEHLGEYLKKMATQYEGDDILMNFVTNHDENSWNGTIAERMGKAAPALTTLTYILPGMPLIYSGQEYDLSHRLKFFEKDQIPKTRGKTWALLEQLGSLKTTLPALRGGKKASSYQVIPANSEHVFILKRQYSEQSPLWYIANLSGNSVSVTLPITGQYHNLMNNQTINLTQKIKLAPWQYYLLEKVK